MEKIVPANITQKGNIVKIIIFVVFFVFLFILIFTPFGARDWTKDMSMDKFVLYTIIIVAIGLGVLVVSRIIMYKLRNKITFYYWIYIFWLFGEILAISFFCTLFAWLINHLKNDYFQIFPYTFLYTTCILFLPYTISWLYLELKEKNIALESIKSHKGKNAIKNIEEEKNQINFTDDKGNLKLSVSIENLFYIEAADNYVKICYINKEKVSHFILRNSLKNIEESFSDINLVRCHRSYIINRTKVKVMRRDKEGLFVELDSKSTPDIPVSKTYSKQVIDLFSESSI